MIIDEVCTMPRRLVPLREIIEDYEDRGGNADDLFASPDDVSTVGEDQEAGD